MNHMSSVALASVLLFGTATYVRAESVAQPPVQTPPARGPQHAPAKPAPAAAPSELAQMSSTFWTDVKKTEGSDDFKALSTALGRVKPPPSAAPKQQRIVDVAVTRPADAAKIMTNVAAAPSAAQTTNAVTTVMSMIATPKTLEQAAALVPPESQSQVETWRANLSNGIPGLPGLYLGDNAEANAPRAEAPAGYAPVAGGSAGCPAK